MTLGDRLLALIEKRPGLTQIELANRLLGDFADSRSMIADLRSLFNAGMIDRRGVGGRGDPYRYYRIKP